MNAMCKFSLDLAQVSAIKHEATQGRVYADRVSLAFAFELLERYTTRKTYWPILDELDCLEGLPRGTRTKKEEQFKHPPLHPLWHKHFSSAAHIPRNIGEHWGLSRDGNSSLTAMIEEVAKGFGEHPDVWPNRLVHRIVIEGYQERAKLGRLTGEWVIFGKHAGKNFYLGTGTHLEGNAANAQQLVDRLRGSSEWEFPFCFR